MLNYKNLYANRIGGTNFGKADQIFKFERIKRAKRAAIKENPELSIIDLGIGESDEMASEIIRNELCKQADLRENRGYADNGITEYKEAAAEFMEQNYHTVQLDPDNEILPIMGSKTAFSMLPNAFINSGDIVLMTVPGYPIIGTKTEWLGGSVYPLPLYKNNDFLPDLKSIPEEVCKKAKLIYVNYPNNPTGAVATKKFYEELITFAQKHQIIVVQDAAYCGLTFDKDKQLSFLSIPVAKEVGVEIHSMSKAYNMTGWRLGFVAGNQNVINALATVKDQCDSGQFRAIQKAGALALKHTELIEQNKEKFLRRHRKLVNVLNQAGFQAKVPDGTFYLYVPVPKGTDSGALFKNAQEFCEYLIKEAHISSVPWSEAGEYVRFSVTYEAETIADEDRVMKELAYRLDKLKFRY